MQPDLFTWTPPEVFGSRDGATFEPSRDTVRLNGQAERVFHAMKDGRWLTLSMIASMAQAPEASVSARCRDFRKLGWTVERRYVANGLHEYRLILPEGKQK